MKDLEELRKLVNSKNGDYLLIIYGNAWEVQFHQTSAGQDEEIASEIHKLNLGLVVKKVIKKVKERRIKN